MIWLWLLKSEYDLQNLAQILKDEDSKILIPLPLSNGKLLQINRKILLRNKYCKKLLSKNWASVLGFDPSVTVIHLIIEKVQFPLWIMPSDTISCLYLFISNETITHDFQPVMTENYYSFVFLMNLTWLFLIFLQQLHWAFNMNIKDIYSSRMQAKEQWTVLKLQKSKVILIVSIYRFPALIYEWAYF